MHLGWLWSLYVSFFRILFWFPDAFAYWFLWIECSSRHCFIQLISQPLAFSSCSLCEYVPDLAASVHHWTFMPHHNSFITLLFSCISQTTWELLWGKGLRSIWHICNICLKLIYWWNQFKNLSVWNNGVVAKFDFVKLQVTEYLMKQ